MSKSNVHENLHNDSWTSLNFRFNLTVQNLIHIAKFTQTLDWWRTEISENCMLSCRVKKEMMVRASHSDFSFAVQVFFLLWAAWKEAVNKTIITSRHVTVVTYVYQIQIYFPTFPPPHLVPGITMTHNNFSLCFRLYHKKKKSYVKGL